MKHHYECPMDTLTKYLVVLILVFFPAVSGAEKKIIEKKITVADQKVIESLQQTYLMAQYSQAQKTFFSEVFEKKADSLEFVYLKIEKKETFKQIAVDQYYLFQPHTLTQFTVQFLNKLNSSAQVTLASRSKMQLQAEFITLSLLIKKAQSVNVSFETNYFDRLHDSLVSQSYKLFQLSYLEANKRSLFFTSYYLNEIGLPLDLTAKHLFFLQKKMNGKKNDQSLSSQALNHYASLLSLTSLAKGNSINKASSEQLNLLYDYASLVTSEIQQKQNLQKQYLKQLALIGDQDKIKDVKREIASNMLWQETKQVFFKPWTILKYIQFVVGYIFVAWPLEIILIGIALVIFSWQSSQVLTREEKRQKSKFKKMWLIFTKAYLGSNVPFFTKLAASLILFGIGLYFNSAKNVVESLVTSF